ncbi:hypothetical protein [Motilimonas eburnea]|uniref:hypothetical protein n=1 Tax=Motilimonas eburnea TaxID=1737488 RepID=UPI001E2DE3E8|nr:hypothetical protein [Motilimonas eburnea]MCE2571752.1 hypothetical protein [Motilimonas eburnea]
MKVLAPYELERLARIVQQNNPKTSCWSLLVLAELVSRTTPDSQWHRARDLVLAVDPDWSKKDCSHIIESLEQISLIDKDTISSGSARFDPIIIRLKPNVMLNVIDAASYDGVISLKLLENTKTCMRVNRRQSPSILLALIAIFVRKISYSGEFYQYIASGGNSRKSLLDKLSQAGIIYQVKVSDASKTGTLIYPVDDIILGDSE